MNVLKKLNQSTEDKPYHGFSKLDIGNHEIVSFRATNNKFGKSVICELVDQIIFLPQYLGQQLGEQDIQELNKCEKKLFLHFGGRHDKKK